MYMLMEAFCRSLRLRTEAIFIYSFAELKSITSSFTQRLLAGSHSEPGTGPSSRGASNEPPPPPLASQTEPPVSKGIEPEQTHTSGTAGGGQSHTTAALMTYKKHSIALIPSDKGKEMAITSADGSLNTINPWVHKEFRLAKELQLKDFLKADDVYSEAHLYALHWSEAGSSELEDGSIP
ncbi:hypothetical protein L7F22_006951 [Adiantum nelumboides]|nr:hypothetical protein [Adiantum nelumboides]